MKNTQHNQRFFSGVVAMSLLENHYDDLPEHERSEMVMDLIFAARELMALRNIINAVVSHESPVSECVPPIISE